MSKYCRIIEHGIVLQDFSGIRDPLESIRAIADAREFMETQPQGEVLVMTDVKGAPFNAEIAQAMQDLAAHHKPWVLGSVLVGLTGPMRLAFRAITTVTGRDIKVLESRTAGIAYLLGRRRRAARSSSSR